MKSTKILYQLISKKAFHLKVPHNNFSAVSNREKLLKDVHNAKPITHDKVTIVGIGAVGLAIAFTLLNQKISKNIVLVDKNEGKLYGETLDLQQGGIFMKNFKISSCKDYSKTGNSRICIITAGAAQKVGETRLDLVQKNTNMLKEILPTIIKYSPNTVLLLVTNPVDVLSYVAWKVSGLAMNKIIGSGTNLDSSRFRFLLSQRLGVAATSCHGFIIGEHGDSSVALWSSVNIAGVKLRDINPSAGTYNDPENWKELHHQVIKSAYEVIKLKGSTSWAVALSVGSIAKSILTNPEGLQAVSINAKGLHCIDDDVFLSLPCLLDADGVCKIVKMTMDEDEFEKLHKSVRILKQVQDSLKL